MRRDSCQCAGKDESFRYSAWRHNGESPSRMLKQPASGEDCYLVCLVCLVCLDGTNQMNLINQINKTNQIDQACPRRPLVYLRRS